MRVFSRRASTRLTTATAASANRDKEKFCCFNLSIYRFLNKNFPRLNIRETQIQSANSHCILYYRVHYFCTRILPKFTHCFDKMFILNGRRPTRACSNGNQSLGTLRTQPEPSKDLILVQLEAAPELLVVHHPGVETVRICPAKCLQSPSLVCGLVNSVAVEGLYHREHVRVIKQSPQGQHFGFPRTE